MYSAHKIIVQVHKSVQSDASVRSTVDPTRPQPRRVLYDLGFVILGPATSQCIVYREEVHLHAGVGKRTASCVCVQLQEIDRSGGLRLCHCIGHHQRARLF
jgi:hypothetical protein